jgi:hypothetical protein
LTADWAALLAHNANYSCLLMIVVVVVVHVDLPFGLVVLGKG